MSSLPEVNCVQLMLSPHFTGDFHWLFFGGGSLKIILAILSTHFCQI